LSELVRTPGKARRPFAELIKETLAWLDRYQGVPKSK